MGKVWFQIIPDEFLGLPDIRDHLHHCGLLQKGWPGTVKQKNTFSNLKQDNTLSLSKDFQPFDLQPPFSVEDVPFDYFRLIGELISVLGAVWFFYKAVRKWNIIQ